MPFPALASHTAYDLERVEVLKGPQGILFGQNSTGGAINFIAAKPTEEFVAGGDVSYSRFNKVEANGYVAGPLTDKLGARLAFTGVKADEWQQSSSRDDENGAEEYFAMRTILEFKPTDTSSYMLNLNGWSDKSDPQALQFIARSPAIPVDGVTGLPPSTLQPLLDQPFSPEDPRAADWSASAEPESDRDFYQVIARGDWDFNNDMTLTVMSTYADFDQQQSTDGDGSPLRSFDLPLSDAEIDTWVTEVRLSGATDSAGWVIGANYEQSDTLEDQVLSYIDNTNYTASNMFIHASGIRNEQEIENYAVFTNVDVALTGRLTAKVGARYTDSSIKVESCNYAAPNMPGALTLDSDGDGVADLGAPIIDTDGSRANVANLYNFLATLPVFNPGGVAFDPISGYPDCNVLNDDGVPGPPYIGELAEDNVSWRIGLDYNLTDTVLVYGNLSKGYKTGSFPSLAASTFAQYKPVTQESVMAYEVGMKSLLLENRMQLNAAAFYYEYDDKQLRTNYVHPLFGVLDILDNVPKSEVTGLEADVIYQLSDHFTLSAAVTYLYSEVKEYKGVSVASEIAAGPNGLELANGPEDFSGDRIPFTPELTFSVDLDYRYYLDNGMEFFAGVTMHGQSSADAAFGGERLTYTAAQLANGADFITPYFNEMDGYEVWDTRIGVASADAKWRLTLWAKNITDEYYTTNVISTNEMVSRYAGRPATYGITLGYEY